MTTYEFGEALRTFNVVTSSALLVLLIAAGAYTWKRLDPVRRLFLMSMTLYVIYTIWVTIIGLSQNIGFRWYTVLLSIANVWLIVSVSLLTIRWPGTPVVSEIPDVTSGP